MIFARNFHCNIKNIIEDKKVKHRNKPYRMSDAEIMDILILFHSSVLRCFKHYYKGLQTSEFVNDGQLPIL